MIKITDYRSIIQEKRKALGLSQQRLADLVGISQPFIHEIEKGKRSPSVEILYKICEVLEIRISFEDIPKEEE